MIIDEATIRLRAGKGGDGCSSFISRKGRRVGSGGEGSRGGDVIFKVSSHIYDLSKFRAKREFSSKNGNNGLENNKSGKAPDDLILYVPEGTIIRDESKNIIFDICAPDDSYLVAKGGKAGKGNHKRKYATGGQPGEKKCIVLDYRIPNDVAILGIPNSGKTALSNALTYKHFKVSEYPFTTTSCMRSQFEFNFKVFTVMDMPALVDKSHEDKGLGNRFLKHLYRTKIIIIIADVTADYRDNLMTVKRQIELFDPSFMGKKVFYLLTKADKIEKEVRTNDFPAVSTKDAVSMERVKKSIYREFSL